MNHKFSLICGLFLTFSCSKAKFEMAGDNKEGADAASDQTTISQGGSSDATAGKSGSNDGTIGSTADAAAQSGVGSGQSGAASTAAQGETPVQQTATEIDVIMKDQDSAIITSDITFDQLSAETQKLNTLYEIELVTNTTNIDLKNVNIKIVSSKESCDASSNATDCLGDVVMDKVSTEIYQNKFGVLVNRSISVYVVIQMEGFAEALFRIEGNATLDVMKVNVSLVQGENCADVEGYCTSYTQSEQQQ